MARDLAGTYGSFSFGGSTARQIDGEVKRTLNNDFETTTVEFDFITTAASDAAFATECLACENAFRIPRQDFVLTQGGSNLESLKQSDNTGLDCAPTITKTGDPADTGKSIKYHVRLEFGRPADNMTEAAIPKGLRYDTITVSYSPSRQRTVTIDGLFTAYSGTGSYEQYLAQITAYAAAVNTSIDANASWEKISEPKIDQNISDKFSSFTVIFKEVIYNQGVNVRDVSAIIDPTMFIDKERFSFDSSNASGFTVGGQGTQEGSGGVNSGTSPTVVMGAVNGINPGGSGNEKPWIVNVSYSASIDKTVTTDLVSAYNNTIRPLLIQAAQAEVQGAGLTMIEDKPEYDPYYNRINVSMQFIAYINNLIERHVTISDRTHFGTVINGVWAPDPYACYDYQGQALKTRTILEEIVQLDISYGGAVMNMIAAIAGPPTGAPGCSLGSNWRVLTREPKGTSIQRGLSDGGNIVYVASYAIETVCQYGNFRSANSATAGQVNGGVATGGGSGGNTSGSSDGSSSPAPTTAAYSGGGLAPEYQGGGFVNGP